jgi:hypothetical protein
MGREKVYFLVLAAFTAAVAFRRHFRSHLQLKSKIQLNHSFKDLSSESNSSSLAKPLPKPFFTQADAEASFQAWSAEQSNSRGIIPVGPQSTETSNMKNLPAGISGALMSEAVRYYKFVDGLAPNELLKKFAKSAPANVQEATKSTIMNLLGSLPNYALDAALVTTNLKLANLLYQMQITGYMFKNAEYRMSMTKLLKGLPKLPKPAEVKSGNVSINANAIESTSITGQVSVRTANGETVQVDVQALAGALSREVNDLRQELATIKNERENELKSNLLTYIQALPEREMTKLTSDMSEDILQAIQLLVNAVMEKLGLENGQEVVIQQSIGHLAQLCMWQMVVGYKLRELEALEKGVQLD